jgi:hypothetical protein
VNRQWLERVERELVGRNLPRRKIRRMVGELGDHLADLETESPAGSPSYETLCTQLGRPEELARAAHDNHLATSYAARHPRLAFLVLPVPLILLGWAVAVFAVVSLFGAAERLPWIAACVRGQPAHAWPAVVLVLIPCLDLLVRVVPPVLIAMLCSHWATQLGTGRRWQLASCLLVAAVAGLIHTSLVLPEAPGQGRWSIGLAFPGGQEQLLQLLIPLLTGMWCACRTARAARGGPAATELA